MLIKITLDFILRLTTDHNRTLARNLLTNDDKVTCERSCIRLQAGYLTILRFILEEEENFEATYGKQLPNLHDQLNCSFLVLG